jgi:hypothetical protein
MAVWPSAEFAVHNVQGALTKGATRHKAAAKITTVYSLFKD